MNPSAVLNIVVNAQTGKAVAQIQAVDAQLKKTAVTSTAATGRIAKAAKWGGAALAVGVAAGLVKSVKASNEFEASFAEVRKTVEASEKGFKRLEDGLRGLSRRIPINVNELNDLAGQAGALGIASKDIVRFTRTSAELGIATDLSASDAANALARLSNIMGTSGKDFRRLGSSFVALGNDGASTEREIAEMALRLAATGKQVGLNEAQVLSFSSALASVGIEAEAGGSAFSKAFSMISSAVATGNESLAGFAEVSGMNKDGFARLFERDAAAGMLAFIEGLGAIKKNGGNALVVLEELGINDVRMRNALLSAAGAGKLFNEQLKIGAQAWRENSALTEEANKRYETTNAKFQVLKNRANDLAITIGNALRPVVRGLLDAMLALTSGNIDQWLGRMAKKSRTAADAVDAVRGAFKVLGPVVRTIIAFARARIEAFLQIIRSVAKVFKGVVHLVTGVVRGDWKRAWDGVKMIASGAVGVVKGVVKGMYAPLTAVFKQIKGTMRSVFSSAWRTVTGIFKRGANKAISFANGVIGVINLIPGIPDIEPFGKLQRGGAVRRQEGGIVPGTGSGDKVPFTGEQGAFVLNRKATEAYGLGRKLQSGGAVPLLLEPGERYFSPAEVQKVGMGRLEKMNRTVRRFQQGGAIGRQRLLLGGVADAAGDVLSGIGGIGGKILDQGADFLLSKLPTPNIPQPFTGVGPYILSHATDFIKDEVKKFVDKHSVSGGNIVAVGKRLQQMGYEVSGQDAFGGRPTSGHAKNSYHYQGRAIDVNDDVSPRGGSEMASLDWLYPQLKKLPHVELLWRTADHFDHLHFAMRLGGLVKKMRKGGKVYPYEAAQLAWGGGFRGTKQLREAVSVAYAESKFDPRANLVTGTEDSRGLWQINTYAHRWAKRKSLYNNKWNAKAARRVWKEAGGSWSPWTGYKSSDYYKFWDRSKHAVATAKRLGLDGSGKGSAEAESNKREKARRTQIAHLRKKAKREQGPLRSRALMWKIINAYAQWGDFDKPKKGKGKNEFKYLFKRVKQITSNPNSDHLNMRLGDLVHWLSNHVDIHGRKKTNKGFGELIARAKTQGGRTRKRKLTEFENYVWKWSGGVVPEKQFNKLNSNKNAIEVLQERIAAAETRHGSVWSEDGSDLGKNELGYELKMNEKLRDLINTRLWAIKGTKKKTGLIDHVRGALRSLEDNPPAAKWQRPAHNKTVKRMRGLLGKMESDIVDLIGRSGTAGIRADVRNKLKDLGATGASGAGGISTSDLLRIVEFAKYGGYKDVPVFHGGGVFHAPPGRSEGPAILSHGETIRTPEQERALGGNVKVEVNFADGMGWLKEFVDVRVVESNRKAGQTLKVGAR